MSEQEFNPNSLNAVLGRVIERLEQGDNTMKELCDTTEKLNDTISGLPCASHDERLKAVEEERKNKSTFWRDVKLSAISTAIGIIATIVTFLIVRPWSI